MNKKLIINDIVLISVIIFILILASYFVYKPSESERIIVMYNNNYFGEYSIYSNITEEIADTGVVLQINNGEAYVSHSECSDKICVDSKPITKNSADGASIVCLPKKVAIIKSSSEYGSEVDAVAG